MRKLLLSMLVLGASVMLKAQNPYPIIPIDSVQFVNDTKLSLPVPNDTMDYISPVFKNPTYRDTFRFEGIVATNPQVYGLSINRKAAYIQRKGGGPWSGVLVMCEPSGTGTTLANLKTETKFYDNFVVGYKVRVTGVARTFNGTSPALKQGETQINLIRNNANWDNFVEQVDLVQDTLVYTEVPASDLQTGNPNTNWQQQRLTGERWEGVLVKIKNVSVYSVQISGNRTFWSVIDDFGNVLDVRDFSAYYRRDDNEDTLPKIANTFQAPPVGTRLDYIQGIVTEYQVGAISRYGICPINPGDYRVCSSCPPVIKYVNRNPMIATSTDTINITVEVTVGDTTLKNKVLYYKKPGSATIDSLVMIAVPSFPNYYVGKIPPVGAEGVLTYWVRAEDNKDRQTFFPDPLTLGKSFYVTTNGVNSIAQLQFSITPSNSTIWDGDSLLNINVRGIVTGKNFLSGATNLITIQDGTGPNSAIFVQRSVGDGTDAWNVGDSVQITRATVRENFNITTVNSILGMVVSNGNPLPPFAMNLPIDSFYLNRIAYARPYEGVLMKWDSVVVRNVNPDAPGQFGEFVFAKDTLMNGLRVDDMNSQLAGLNNKIKKGMKMNFIQGPMYYSFGNFKLIPRGLSDLDLSQMDSVAPEITLLGENPDTVPLNSGAYTDPGATATDNIDGNITANIIKSGTVNTAAVGTYTLKYKVSDAWGNMDSTERIVVVVDTATVGVNENEMNFAQLGLYPNPANESVTVSANFIKTQPVTVSIIDILGREVISKTYTKTQFADTINLSNCNNGVYFCVISNATGSKTMKFIVNNK